MFWLFIKNFIRNCYILVLRAYGVAKRGLVMLFKLKDTNVWIDWSEYTSVDKISDFLIESVFQLFEVIDRTWGRFISYATYMEVFDVLPATRQGGTRLNTCLDLGKKLVLNYPVYIRAVAVFEHPDGTKTRIVFKTGYFHNYRKLAGETIFHLFRSWLMDLSQKSPEAAVRVSLRIRFFYKLRKLT